MIFARSRWSKPLTLLAMCLGLFMPQLDTNVVNLALPSIQRSLHVDMGALQWIIDSYNLMFASLLVTGGTLGDLFGRRRLFLIGVVLFALACPLPILIPKSGRMPLASGRAWRDWRWLLALQPELSSSIHSGGKASSF